MISRLDVKIHVQHLINIFAYLSHLILNKNIQIIYLLPYYLCKCTLREIFYKFINKINKEIHRQILLCYIFCFIFITFFSTGVLSSLNNVRKFLLGIIYKS